MHNSESANSLISADVKNNNVINTRKIVSTTLYAKNNIATSTSESDVKNNADIKITQSASNYNPNYGKYVKFSVKIKNNGPNTAKNITISYLLNNHYLKWTYDNSNGSYNHTTGIWYLKTLENGTNITLNVVTQIIASNINITNNAIYKSGLTLDPNTLNNIASTTLKVPPSADIRVTSIASNYNPKYLHHIYIAIKVKNTGPNEAKNLIINSGLNPKLLKYISCFGNGHYDANTGIWTIYNLKSGSTYALYIKVKIMAFKTKIINNISYHQNTFDFNAKNNNARISLTVPGLTISSLASALAIDTKSKYDKALNIFNWVRDYVDYSFYYGTRYGASGTLKLLKGNCVDLSRLIVSLARHSGLTARYKYGTCYFYKSHHWISHVWTNLFANGRWYAADASNNINELGVIKSWNTSNFTLNGVYKTLPF